MAYPGPHANVSYTSGSGIYPGLLEEIVPTTGANPVGGFCPRVGFTRGWVLPADTWEYVKPAILGLDRR